MTTTIAVLKENRTTAPAELEILSGQGGVCIFIKHADGGGKFWINDKSLIDDLMDRLDAAKNYLK